MPTVPFIAAVGTPAGDVGPITPGMPAHQADDILLALFECNNGTPLTLTDAQGFTEIPNSPVATGGSGGVNGECVLTVFAVRATSSGMLPPTTADTGNHQFGYILAIRGCETSGDPWDAIAADILATNTAPITIPGATTTKDACLVLAIACYGKDGFLGDFVDGWANADLANVVEVADFGTDAGNGGGIAVASGEKVTAGAYGGTAAHLASGCMSAHMTIAFKPPASVVGQMVADAAAIAEACGVAFVGSLVMPQTMAASGLALVGAQAFTGTILTPPVLRKHKRRRIAAALAAGHLRRST